MVGHDWILACMKAKIRTAKVCVENNVSKTGNALPKEDKKNTN
jgi:hypothetical protein